MVINFHSYISTFYRMENTQICEQIIKDFNGEKIPGDCFLSKY